MKKIAFRTFVYSFAISTLVIFSINKMPSYFPHKNTPTVKTVKYKNISSFVKDTSAKTISEAPSDGEEDLNSYNNEEAESFDISFEEDTNNASVYYNNDNEAIDLKEDIDIAEAFSDETISTYDNKDITTAEDVTPKNNEIIESNPSWQIDGFDIFNNTPRETSEESLVATEEVSKKDLIPIQKTGLYNKDEKITITSKAEPNQVAMSQADASLKNMITEESSSQNLENETADNNPWVVAKGSKFPSNNMMLELSNSEESKAIKQTFNTAPKPNGEEIKVAEMVRNILIPIPEDILKEGNVTPQLISSKRNKDLQEKIEQNIREKRTEEEEKPSHNKQEEKVAAVIDDENSEKIDGKKTIFDSISSIFSAKSHDIGVSKNTNEQKFDTVNSVYAIKKDNKSKKNNKVTKILPTEIKLSFQPNRAEISGQTLKWIEAFANKTIEDGSVALEIRIDGTSSFELQQKRLSLLHNILTNKGVEYKKINTVFTTREPNSFIIRTVRINDKSVAMDGNPKIKEDSSYYQKW